MDHLSKEGFDTGGLENRIANTLQEKGLITRKSAKMKVQKMVWQIAASLALLLVGYFIGKQGTAPTARNADRNQYALFLYENDEFKPPEGKSLVAEYSEWARHLDQAGKLVYAEKLDDSDIWLGNNSVQNHTSKLAGYFVFYAKDLAEAQEIARTHPHPGYGGGLELRPIFKIE